MIFTKQWLNEWVDINSFSLEEIETTLNRIGLEVDNSKKFSVPDGVVVGEIKSIEQHPNADRLRVCLVDIGEVDTLQIVTNDQNVQVGDFVPVATVGTQLPKVKIKKGKLRGVESFGMFCSTEEFGMERVGDGVVVLDSSIGELKTGKSLSLFPIFNDEMVEIELTANRGDCLSIYGIARDLATALNLDLKHEIPQVDEVIGEIKDFDYNIQYLTFDNIKTLPLYLKIRLANIKKLTNNPLQNILNYVTHSTGVILKTVKDGSNELNYHNNILQVGDSQIGIYSPKVEESRTIEISYINPEIVSKLVYENNLQTDELYYNSSRGSEPSIELATQLLEQLSLFNTLKSLAQFTNIKGKREVKISFDEISNFIGANISKYQIIEILEKLGFDVYETDSDLLLQVPKFRHDIVNQQDVIEEILRIIGIDNIPSQRLAFLEKRRENTSSKKYLLKSHIRAKAISNGFYESMTYLFGEEKVFNKYGFETIQEDKKLLNPIVDTMDTLRPTVVIGLLNGVQRNINFGKRKVPLFEIGKVFSKTREEREVVTFIFSGEVEEPSIANSGKPKEIDFETFAKKVLSSIGGGELQQVQPVSQLQHPYQTAEIIQDGNRIGYIYKLRLDVQEEFNIPTTYVSEIEFDSLKLNIAKAQSYSKYQNSIRDLSLVIPSDMKYKRIKQVINSLNNPLLQEFYPIDIFQLNSDEVSLTIRFSLQSMETTLEEDDITQFINLVLENLYNHLNIKMR